MLLYKLLRHLQKQNKLRMVQALYIIMMALVGSLLEHQQRHLLAMPKLQRFLKQMMQMGIYLWLTWLAAIYIGNLIDADGKAIVPQPDASKLTAVYKIGNDEFYKATDGSYVNVVNGAAYTLPPTATFPLPESSGDYGPKFVTQADPAPGVAQTTYEQAEFKKADGTYLTAEEAKKVKGEEKIPSDGYTVSTQEAAQKALTAINNAIESKDKIRAHLGAMQNRLENTITNLNVQAENLQAAESRISDVDVATEMTQFVRNQILTQSAVAMLGQANSLPQMAMQLIGG